MTYNNSRRPNSIRSSSTPTTEDIIPKPYKLIPLPQQTPVRGKPIGQDAFKNERLSGKISLRLTVKTTAFVASGLVAMGSDLDNRMKQIPLIKVAVNKGEKLIIPGSSLKGAVRSAYEAITQSCLCKTKTKQIPEGYNECRNKNQLCPACQVFGAMDWQGLISFSDAIAKETKPSVGFMPSLYAPRTQRQAYYQRGKVAGRKFYYHAVKAVDRGSNGIPVQQAGTDLIFSTQIKFMNLSKAELGTLLIVLGQDSNYYMALKVGGGKPVGMGTMTVEVNEIESPTDWRSRYLEYTPSDANSYTHDRLKEYMQPLIKTAHQQLVQAPQLKELQAVWQWPTNRQAPENMY
jgi:RAMP superfamily